jgi:hypothetical protein
VVTDRSHVPIAQGTLGLMRELSERLGQASITSEIVCPPARGGGG